jgi:hypothetical protein
MSVIRNPIVAWPEGYEGIYHPSKTEHPVVTKLKLLNYYLKQMEDGLHLLICPFHKDPFFEHNVATYKENSRLDPHGWFTCKKCGCHKSPHLFYEKIGVHRHEILHKSLILIVPGFFEDILDSCEQELARCGNIFQRGGKIVKVDVDSRTGEINITELYAEEIHRILSSRSCFLKLNSKDKWDYCDLPSHYSTSLYKGRRYQHLHELRGIAMQPYLRPDGSLITTPGFDQDTGIFSDFKESDAFFPPAEPTKKDAENALQGVLNLLIEFPFKTEEDRSAAIAGILTAVIRPSLSHAPMFHCNASQISSGKTYLMKCISAFATPFPVASSEFPRSEDECRKQIFALLRKAPPVIFFDNVNIDLPNYTSLCSILTEENFSSRILGQSDASVVSTRTLFLSNGNNVLPTKDMVRRVITITLHPTYEIPATKRYSNTNLLNEIIGNRPRYICLALTMIRAWIVAGRPIKEVPPIATYGDWSNYCRQVLLWLGLPDPATSLFIALNKDPDREILGCLLHAWYDLFKSQSVMLRYAIENSNDILKEVFIEINGGQSSLNRRKLGRWLKRHAGCIVDGLKFEHDDSVSLSAHAWRVISV